MTLDHETRVRAAVTELADALLAAAEAAQIRDLPDRLLSVDQAAEVCGVSRTRLYTELQSGRLRSIKVGRRRLVPSSAIAEFAAGR